MQATHILAAAGVAVALIFGALPANATTLSLEGPAEKVCQLTGQLDWATNAPTAARTFTEFGLRGVDLGFPLDAGSGGLYLLFGDAWPPRHPPNSIPSIPPDDAMGWTARQTTPNTTQCIDLRLLTSAPHVLTSAPRLFAHPVVEPQIRQGAFNVPSGGVVLDGTLYAFFWTNHCSAPGPLAPNPNAPLTLPAPFGTCVQAPSLNSVGSSVLAAAPLSAPLSFQQVLPPSLHLVDHPTAQMPSGFVYVSAAPARLAGPPLPKLEAHEDRVAVFGVSRYRASIPYLASAPRATFGDPSTWLFFAGRQNGAPVWVTRAQWESGRTATGAWSPPSAAEIYTPTDPSERCVGEHSVTWNAPLHTWLLLYNCGVRGIEARTAPAPYGPWSSPIVLLSAEHDPSVVCQLIMRLDGCAGLPRVNYWPTLPHGDAVPGGFYGPFVLNRFTQDVSLNGNGAARRATIYWAVSTWNPYNVVVMRSTLELAN